MVCADPFPYCAAFSSLWYMIQEYGGLSKFAEAFNHCTITLYSMSGAARHFRESDMQIVFLYWKQTESTGRIRCLAITHSQCQGFPGMPLAVSDSLIFLFGLRKRAEPNF